MFSTARTVLFALGLAAAVATAPMGEFSAAQARDQVLNLQPAQSHVVKLARDAGSIVVANPNHLTAILDQPDVLVLIPNTPGRTSIMVMDEEGRPIYSRMVRIRDGGSVVNVVRNCTDGAANCAPVETLDCDGRCVHVTYPEPANPGDVELTEPATSTEGETPQEPMP